ncbi:MAG: FliH/SctL family protein [Polyangiaceae bacterium]|nr:FliH/SctL family protein [Polyangiaceae bacterium]
MSIERARVIQGAFAEAPVAAGSKRPQSPPGRRIPKLVVDAHDQASKIVGDATAKATAIVEEAKARAVRIGADSAKEAREKEIAKLAAEMLAFRAAEETHREREIDRTIEVAVVLAERLVGQTLQCEPERIALLAAEALRETRGARQVRMEANPADVPALSAALATLGTVVADVVPNVDLGRGSLVVQTELGRIDGRLEPQLSRLAEALRDALRPHSPTPKGATK